MLPPLWPAIALPDCARAEVLAGGWCICAFSDRFGKSLSLLSGRGLGPHVCVQDLADRSGVRGRGRSPGNDLPRCASRLDVFSHAEGRRQIRLGSTSLRPPAGGVGAPHGVQGHCQLASERNLRGPACSAIALAQTSRVGRAHLLGQAEFIRQWPESGALVIAHPAQCLAEMCAECP